MVWSLATAIAGKFCQDAVVPHGVVGWHDRIAIEIVRKFEQRASEDAIGLGALNVGPWGVWCACRSFAFRNPPPASVR